ncbi:FYVE zinc finger domain-containing protein [Ditylenchus destructor]|nr:FYVE zinc finger domain-containing protein [Ditylenchus destructor]
MNVLSFVPNLVGAELDKDLSKDLCRRSLRIHRENEHNNLVAITQLVLNSFLDDAIRGNRVIDAENREICDLLIMLEKILWHGFKNPSVLRMRKADAEMWSFIEQVSKNTPEMLECFETVAQMDELSTFISKFRAFWRLAVIQKRLAEYFQAIVGSSSEVSTYYEPWAFLKSERSSTLGGVFLSLGVFDFRLIINFDQLQDQVCSLDISPYLKIPTLPGQIPQQAEELSKAETEADIKVLLDQNHYLEERNRQLTHVIFSKLFKKNLLVCKDDNNQEHNEQDDVSLSFNERLWDLERERQILQARLAEREDTVQLTQEQLTDTKRLNEDLYEKLRYADGMAKRFQNDLKTLKSSHANEIEELKRSLDSFRNSENDYRSKDDNNQNSVTMLRNELANKTQQYMNTMTLLNEKQQELSIERERIAQIERRCFELEKKSEKLATVEQELVVMKSKHEKSLEQLISCQQALQELGGHLSESKLKMVELREENLLLNDAGWVKDSEVMKCKLCEVSFSVTQRRHHCRNCGWIFCANCSSTRVKLPSNAKPARVCIPCYDILRNRQMSSNHTSTSSN